MSSPGLLIGLTYSLQSLAGIMQMIFYPFPFEGKNEVF